jgi:hypothetical protein
VDPTDSDQGASIEAEVKTMPAGVAVNVRFGELRITLATEDIEQFMRLLARVRSTSPTSPIPSPTNIEANPATSGTGKLPAPSPSLGPSSPASSLSCLVRGDLITATIKTDDGSNVGINIKSPKLKFSSQEADVDIAADSVAISCANDDRRDTIMDVDGVKVNLKKKVTAINIGSIKASASPRRVSTILAILGAAAALAIACCSTCNRVGGM